MAGEKQINLRFRVTDEGTITLDKIAQGITKVEKSAQGMSSSLSLIKWDSIVNLGKQLISTGEQAVQFLEIGAKAKQTEEIFQKVTAASGIMGRTLIDSLKDAGKVFVEETGLMSKAQRALAEGVKAEDLPKLMNSARVAARLMGTDVSDSFDKVMDAVISLRTRGLRDAFPMDQAEVLKTYANSLGATAEDLTVFGERQAIVNEILKQTEEKLKIIGPLQDTQSESLQRLKSTASEVWEVFSKTTVAVLDNYGKNIDEHLISPTKKAIEYMKSEIPFLSKFWNFLAGKPAAGTGGGALSEIKEKGKEFAETPEEKKSLERQRDLKMGWDIEKRTMEGRSEGIYSYIDAMNKVGVVSERFYASQAKESLKSFGDVQTAFQKGEATAGDYKASLQSLIGQMEKALPTDPTDALVSLEEETSNRLKAINRETEGWGIEANRIIDEQNKKRNLIMGKSIGELEADLSDKKSKFLSTWGEIKTETTKEPLEVLAEFAPGAMDGLTTEYERVKASIEANSIKINVDTSAMGGAGGAPVTGGAGTPGSPENVYASNMGMVTGAFADQNFDVKLKFYGEASPKKPLSETIRDLSEQFGGLQELINSLTMSIKFGEAEMQIDKLEKQLQQYKEVGQSWQNIVNSPYGSINMKAGFKDPQIDLLNSLMAGVTQQINMVKSNQLLDILNMFAGSFQFGTTYVPKTGLAMVHEGEKITPKNVRYGDSNAVFHIYGTDPKRTADEIAKILKYRRSSDLRDATRR
jgi:hypothetical protein